MAGGRPTVSRSIKRDHAVRVRLSGDELAALTTFASEAGLSTSEVLRRLAREAAGLGPTFGGDEARIVAANVAQLRKAGINLNQIARALNAGRAPGYGDLKGGVERLARIVAEQIVMLEGMCARARARATARVKRDV